MRLKMIGYCVVALVLSLASSGTAATLIDFESLPAGSLSNGSSLLSPYGIASVTFGGPGSQAAPQVRNMSDPDADVPSGVNMFLPAGFFFPNTGVATTTLSFATPVTFFSFAKYAESNAPYTYGIAGWKAEAFDASNGLVATAGIGFASGLDFPSPGPVNQTFTLTGANPITKVVFSVNYNGNSTSGTVPIDDFQFQQVPEPGALSLSALIAVTMWRRRRGKRACAHHVA